MVNNTLALDVGQVRVGVAIARADVRVPVALSTLPRTREDFWEQLDILFTQYDIGEVVLGLPRGLNGQETSQTAAVRAFAVEMANHTTLPIIWQDEALTSVKAEATLKNSGQPYEKTDIDALAACYILSDYIDSIKVRT